MFLSLKSNLTSYSLFTYCICLHRAGFISQDTFAKSKFSKGEKLFFFSFIFFSFMGFRNVETFFFNTFDSQTKTNHYIWFFTITLVKNTKW